MVEKLPVKIVELTSGCIPVRAHSHDAGADLKAHEDVTIPAKGRALVGTGVAIETPAGYVSMVCSRSGLAHKKGVHVLNAPGIVDAGYTGEIFVNLHNTTDEDVHISAFERVAQLIITPVVYADFVKTDKLGDSDRGANGHGSTGN